MSIPHCKYYRGTDKEIPVMIRVRQLPFNSRRAKTGCFTTAPATVKRKTCFHMISRSLSLEPHLHTLSIMCVTRRSEMPGHDSSARLKAFSSSSMAPTPPPAARLFSFSWATQSRTRAWRERDGTTRGRMSGERYGWSQECSSARLPAEMHWDRPPPRPLHTTWWRG